MQKQASGNFVWGLKKFRELTSAIKNNASRIDQIKKELSEIEKNINHFSAKRITSTSAKQVADAEKGLQEATQKAKLLNEEMRQLILDTGNLQQPIANTAEIIRVGVGVPAVVGGTYGFLSFKNNKQEG